MRIGFRFWRSNIQEVIRIRETISGITNSDRRVSSMMKFLRSAINFTVSNFFQEMFDPINRSFFKVHLKFVFRDSRCTFVQSNLRFVGL